MRTARWLPRPLTLAQILSSAAGALPMLVAAVRMEPGGFTFFAVVVLAATLAVGVARAGLFQPALIHQRVDSTSRVPARYAVIAVSCAALVLALVAWFVGQVDGRSLVVIALAGAIPVGYDWLRFRAIGTSQRWLVAVGDAVRLAVVSAVALPVVAAEPTVFFAFIGGSCAAAALVVVTRVPLRVGRYPYRSYRAHALWQTGDFVVGQFVVSVPLIVLGGLSNVRLIGSVRFAQTLLGPFNLAFAAAVANIVADGATSAAHREAAALIAQGRRSAARLAGLATLIVAAVAAGIWLSGFSPRGVAREDLYLGITLVGASMVMSGWSGIHAIVLRVLGHQAAVTRGRLVIAASTTTGFVVGYLVGGEPLSLILGFGANAIVAPLTFLPLAHRYYRRETGS